MSVCRAIFPGSFDPVTEGHVDIIRKSLEVFDEVVVVVMTNPDKRPMFMKYARFLMLKEALRDVRNVRVEVVDGLTVDAAKRLGATHIVRSMRFAFDYEYELETAWNNEAFGGIATVFFPPDKGHLNYRSTTVRQLARLKRFVEASMFLPKPMQKDAERWLTEGLEKED